MQVFKDTGGEMSHEHPRSSSLVSLFFFFLLRALIPPQSALAAKCGRESAFLLKVTCFLCHF